jgi:hypothetical protein
VGGDFEKTYADFGSAYAERVNNCTSDFMLGLMKKNGYKSRKDVPENKQQEYKDKLGEYYNTRLPQD